jgi:hypothetical protein
MEFPKHFEARRIGYGETEYDAFGEAAPLSWVCVTCGSMIAMEFFDEETEQYMDANPEYVQRFIDRHMECPNKVIPWMEMFSEIMENYDPYDSWEAHNTIYTELMALLDMNMADPEFFEVIHNMVTDAIETIKAAGFKPIKRMETINQHGGWDFDDYDGKVIPF